MLYYRTFEFEICGNQGVNLSVRGNYIESKELFPVVGTAPA